MPFTLHGDILFIYRTPNYLVHGEWNAYGIAFERFGTHYYPVLTLLLFAGFDLIFHYLSSVYATFLDLLDTQMLFKEFLEFNQLFLCLFLMKIPYLLFDLLVVQTGWKMIEDESSKRKFTELWAWNPILIYIVYMVGQFDLIPAYCVFLAFYFSLKPEKSHWAALSLAAGCLFKIFPIIFLPMIICIASRSWMDAIRLFLLGVLPVILVYGIFSMTSDGVALNLFDVFAYRTTMTRDYKIMVIRLLQATAYGLTCLHILFFNRKTLDYKSASKYFLIIYLAIYFGITPLAIQYLAWIIPVAMLYHIADSGKKTLLYSVLFVALLQGFRARPEAFGIFAPLNPELFLSLPSFMDMTGFLFNQNIFDQIADYLFKISSSVLAITILRSLDFKTRKPT